MREIVRVITAKGDNAGVIPQLTSDVNDDGAESLSARFINGIRNGEWRSDEEAANALYGTNTKDQRFRTLKSRTYERLVHGLLFLQVKQPEHSEYLAYYYRCTRNLLCAQSLRRFAAMNAAQHIAVRTLTIAQKYQYTEICLSLCKLLGEIATLSGRRRDFDRYSSLVRQHLGELSSEYQAEELLDKYFLNLRYAKRSSKALLDDAKDVQTVIESLFEQHPTHLMHLNLYRARNNYYQARSDYLAIINSCDEAIDYLDKHPHLAQKARYGEFLFEKLVCCLTTRKYEDAYDMAERCVAYFTSGGRNWYTSVELAFSSAMNLGNYQRALYYYNLATTHDSWEHHPEANVREFWTLANAYLVLAKRLGIHDYEIPGESKFRLTTFINSMPEEQKANKITYVFILFAQILFLIESSDYDSAEKRIDYMKVYASRWLRDPSLHRIRVFVRLLTNVARNSFDVDRIRANSDKLLVELRASQSTPSIVSEFLPFEIIHEYLVRLLERHNIDSTI